MGDWKLLASILDEVHAHSTVVGKVWLTVLFVFRMLVLAVAAEDVWEDEQAQFVCNTEQPGCKAVCYDRAFPISLVRFWMLQVVFVSAPSLFYIGHALYRVRRLEKGRRRQRARLREESGETEDVAAAATAWAPTEEEEEQRRRKMARELRRIRDSSSSRRRVKRAPLRGSLLRTYVLHILTRSALEVCFLLGQCALYGVRVEPLYRCGPRATPCPNVVDCYVSRPTEKTVFMAFMVAIAGVSLLLSALEIAHLGAGKIRRTLGRGSGGWEEEEEEACLEDEDRGLASEPANEPLIATSRASRQQQQRAAATPPPDTRPPPPPPRRSPAEVEPSLEEASSLRSAHSTPGTLRPGESLQRKNSPPGGQTPTTVAADGPPQGRETRQLPSPDGGKGNPRRTGNHLQPPRSVKALLSGSTAVHRPSVVCSLGSGAGLLFPNARKSSFLQARAPSESMLSTMSGSSSSSDDSLHSSEGSDVLGSLHGDTMHTMAPPAGRRMSMVNPPAGRRMSMVNPPAGRRMSMSVFLDISSIMKK